jgi:hypothetical protein
VTPADTVIGAAAAVVSIVIVPVPAVPAAESATTPVVLIKRLLAVAPSVTLSEPVFVSSDCIVKSEAATLVVDVRTMSPAV